jgi:hypothetical protein
VRLNTVLLADLLTVLPGYRELNPPAAQPVPEVVEETGTYVSDLRLEPISYQGWTITFVIARELLNELEALGATAQSIQSLCWWPSAGKGTWDVIKPRSGQSQGYELKVNGNDLKTIRWRRPTPKGTKGLAVILFRRNDSFDEK